METISRTIMVALLGLSLAGCGSKATPSTDANIPSPPDSISGQAARAVYELDTAKHAIPNRTVGGLVGGVEVAPQVSLDEDSLRFRTLKPGTEETEREVAIKIRTDISKPLPIGKRVVRDDMPSGPEVPFIQLIVGGKEEWFPNGYAMTLDLEPRKEGKLIGKIYLCLADEHKSYLAGTFVAAAPRLAIEPPGLEDVPLVSGTVTVAGAGPGTVLITGYAASPNDASKVGTAAADLELRETPGISRSVSIDYDKPRVTSLIAGDGKMLPSKYEHSKLTPGRYLTFAMLKEGPAAWRWIEVRERTAIAVDLTVDATKVGGLEVTAPLGSLQKIQLAPADDAERPPMDAILFELIALQMKLEKDIVGRKALFKNLAPGRYEVRDKASGLVRFVEVVAGKTIELDFDAKPEPPKKPDAAPEPKSKG